MSLRFWKSCQHLKLKFLIFKKCLEDLATSALHSSVIIITGSEQWYLFQMKLILFFWPQYPLFPFDSYFTHIHSLCGSWPPSHNKHSSPPSSALEPLRLHLTHCSNCGAPAPWSGPFIVFQTRKKKAHFSPQLIWASPYEKKLGFKRKP